MVLMSQRESIVAPPAGYSTQIARLADLESSLGLAIRGKPDVVRLSLVCLLARGHLLIEDVPGVGKTTLAQSLARSVNCRFHRLQFTSDMLPSDVLGVTIYNVQAGAFEFKPGPIFANFLLADEINRTTPKTQSALLEAMQEYQVTLEGETQGLPAPFIVIATQNPIEYEGTFPLPEAQLDRFFVRLSIGYPTPEEEDEILRQRSERRRDLVDLHAVVSPETFLAMRAAVEEVYVDPDVRRYIVDLVARTRQHRQVVVGASPRASIALLKLAKAWAAIQGRAFVVPDDVKCFLQPVLAHRIVLDPALWDVKTSDKAVIEEVVRLVPVPVLPQA